MFTNARKYFLENVLPSYQDFLEHRESNDWGENQLLRKGIVAATALFHLREHLPDNIKPSKTSLRNQYSDYGLIGDITNVAKHHEISKDSPRISNASQIYEALRLIVFTDEQGEYTSSQLEIYVKLDDGTEIKLINILYKVMLMWLNILNDLGIKDMIMLKPLNIDVPLSRDEANKRGSNMGILEGEEYQWQFRMEKYNYDKKIVEPMDVTDMNMQYRIFQLPDKIPMRVHFTNSEMDIEFEFNVPLSKEEATHYISLENKEKEEAFIKNLVETTPNIKREFDSKLQSVIQERM